MREAKILVFVLALAWIGAANADEETTIEPGLITWAVQSGESTLRISSPDGTVGDLLFEPGENPSFSIFDQAGELIPDGQYNWELLVKTPGSTRRLQAPKTANKSLDPPTDEQVSTASISLSGAFRVWNGAFVTHDSTETLEKDQVIPDDLIVEGSLCVGLDCQNNEDFDDDTIRLKERELRITFQDTSTMQNFPSNDWGIAINDLGPGGQDRFSIEDVDAPSTPFTIEAGAPDHTLYLDDIGRIGLGTSTPVTELHIKSGDTPTLRMEQDDSSGMTPQIWDVAGNETSFFVRDTTNGSTLPLQIRPGAPTSALDIAGTSGNVGMGTPSPSTPLHVKRSDGLAKVLVEEGNAVAASRILLELQNKGGVLFRLNNTDNNSWDFLNAPGGGFQISRTGSGVVEFLLSAAGDLRVTGGLVSGTPAGTCNPGPCDGIFLPDYDVESIEEHASFMWENNYLWGVGPTIEGQPMNLTKKTAGILHELEKAHIYIEQLNNRLKEKDDALASVNERLERLEVLLASQAGSQP